jgi:hypothetical protein
MYYAILIPFEPERHPDLKRSDIFFYSDEEGSTYIFDSEDEAVDYRDDKQIDGQVIELFTK